MIHVTLSGLLVTYLLLVLGGLGLIWMASEFDRARRAWRVRKTFVICRTCGHHYRDTTPAPVVVCPECGRPNERESMREI